MQLTNVLCVFYCVVPLVVKTLASWGYCNFQGETNQWAYCRSRMVNRTFEFIPVITEPVTHIIFDNEPLKQLPRDAFRNVTTQTQLSHVDLLNCQISHIDADALLHLNNLEHLSLNRNSIAHLESGTFQHTKKLKYLYVANNNVIKRLQTGLFQNLVLLNSVSFYKNILTHIENGTFSNTPSLGYINLAGNKLEFLDPLFKDSFVNLTDLNLDGNPWNCDCKLRELFELHKVHRPASEYTEPICQNPPALRGRNWSDLTSNAFICELRIILPMNDTRVVALGTNITMSCAVFSDPVPDMKWNKDSNVIPLENKFITSNKDMHYLNYTFTVQEEDLGEYHCVVNNTQGVQESSITLTMDQTTLKAVSINTELVDRTTEATSSEIVIRISEPALTNREFVSRNREPVPTSRESVSSMRDLVSIITLNEPAITIKESGSRIKELSSTSGPNGTITVEVTMNVVLELPKNLEWLTNVRVTPVRVTHRAKQTSLEPS